MKASSLLLQHLFFFANGRLASSQEQHAETSSRMRSFVRQAKRLQSKSAHKRSKNSKKRITYDRKVRIGAQLANGKVFDLGQCVLCLFWMSGSTDKFREKEIVPSPAEDARLAGVVHGGPWREDGPGGAESGAQTKLYAEDRRLGYGVRAQATSAEHGK